MCIQPSLKINPYPLSKTDIKKGTIKAIKLIFSEVLGLKSRIGGWVSWGRFLVVLFSLSYISLRLLPSMSFPIQNRILLTVDDVVK